MSFTSRDYLPKALFEHRFWLRVLKDHALFIYNALAPKEIGEIQQAEAFHLAFGHLLSRANHPLEVSELHQLNEEAYHLAHQLREFKLHLLRRHLVGEIAIQLPPTFINHMVNELEEYLRILGLIIQGDLPPIDHPVHHHLLWLPDAAGHAATISSTFDPVEKRMKEKSDTFTQHFEDFYYKAIEVAGYLRANLDRFPALAYLNQEVELEMKLFRGFLHELEELRLNKEILGTLLPLMADHMAREECYYLIKLAESSAKPAPACDPTDLEL